MPALAFSRIQPKLCRMKKIPLLLIGLCTLHVLFPQGDKEKMQRERQQLQAELKEIQANYNKVKGQQKATIGQLNMLQNKLQVQNRYINNISSEEDEDWFFLSGPRMKADSSLFLHPLSYLFGKYD